ncbi:sensor histidine kinase [Reyranella soli]|uniref:sensor histidine kinase n=1 Tax=Reyranella soli TaxID=1230389 RepID=UPI001478645A|nr:sensor histidine kinase [Reyranella soli]
MLDTVPEPAFDRITALTADLFQAPVAIIGFIGSDRVFFKSHHGTAETEARRGTDPSRSVLEPWIRDKYKYGFHAGVPLDSPDGYAIGTLSVIDRRPRRIEEQHMRRLRSLAGVVTDELAMRLAARTASDQADIMKSEVDHRVMNSLQLVSSMLQLQGRSAASTETRQQLLTAAHRVAAVARAHRLFSVNETRERLPIVSHLRELCSELAGILGAEIGVVGAIETSVPRDQVLAIGLIVNELAVNARKHGAGLITVSFGWNGGLHELAVTDQGEGLERGFSVTEPTGKGIGMKVVRALADQLKGQLSVRSPTAGRGTCVAVSFPAR